MSKSVNIHRIIANTFEPGHSISYNIAYVPSEDSDQPAHPRSLIRIFTGQFVASQNSKATSDGQQHRENIPTCI